MNFKLLFLIPIVFLLLSCASPPPQDVNNICNIFEQYPKWYRDALDVEKRWRVPIAVQMAIIHQESKFEAGARPPRTKLMWVIPWKRPSSAYGYTQALRSTWSLYKRSNIGGSIWSSRDVFSDAVDFVGWYINEAHVRAGISRKDAYHLYLAYHEGIGGYQRRSYLKKAWLVQVAHKVSARSQIYAAQLRQCHARFTKKTWF